MGEVRETRRSAPQGTLSETGFRRASLGTAYADTTSAGLDAASKAAILPRLVAKR
jgi:hypothetical protein